MADVFTTTSANGFNASPPPDDASEVEANVVEWAKHIQKIGTPLKNYIDALQSNITSAFAKSALLGGVKAVATTYTLLSTDQGKVLNCTGTFTLTLLSASAAGDQFTVMIVNTGTGIITVDGSGSETINGEASIDVYPLDSLLITSDGSNWLGNNAKGVVLTSPTNNQVLGYNSTTKQIENITQTIAGTFVNEAQGFPVISTGSFSFTTDVTETTWESVGPTSPGTADNIWGALDSVPTDVDWIEVAIDLDSLSTADTADTYRYHRVNARKGGSVAAASAPGRILTGAAFTNSSGSARTQTKVSTKIPVNALEFDIYWESSFNSTISSELYLIGYGYNP